MRRNLGAYLHDRIGQTLSIIKIKLEMLGTSLTDGNTREKHSDILRLLETAIQDTRNLSYKLSPVVLHELGLEAALGWLAEQTAKEHNIAVTFRSDKKPQQVFHHQNNIFCFGTLIEDLLFSVPFGHFAQA